MTHSNITIGVCGPVDLKLLDWDLSASTLPDTNAFPLTSHYINGLLKYGLKVVAYTHSSKITQPQVYESGNLKVVVCQQKPQPGRRFFKFEIDEIKKAIHAHPVDVISVFWTYEYAWAALSTNIPTIVNIHDNALKIFLKQPDMFRFVRLLMNLYTVNKAKYLIANSSYTYNVLNASLKAKTRVVNNFYTSSLKQSLNSTNQKGNYIITAIQGFTKRKNVHGGLEAFAKLRKKFPTLEYYLVGIEMEENGNAHQYARANNLDEGVRFLGMMSVNKVFKKIAGAKVLLHPSVEESFGMAVLEAMVAGTAVVGGLKSGYIPTLLDNGNAGKLCDITSPDEMASAVENLLLNDQLRENIENKAKAFAHANFSEEVIMKQHLDIISEVLGKKVVPEQAKIASYSL